MLGGLVLHLKAKKEQFEKLFYKHTNEEEKKTLSGAWSQLSCFWQSIWGNSNAYDNSFNSSFVWNDNYGHFRSTWHTKYDVIVRHQAEWLEFQTLKQIIIHEIKTVTTQVSGRSQRNIFPLRTAKAQFCLSQFLGSHLWNLSQATSYIKSAFYSFSLSLLVSLFSFFRLLMSSHLVGSQAFFFCCSFASFWRKERVSQFRSYKSKLREERFLHLSLVGWFLWILLADDDDSTQIALITLWESWILIKPRSELQTRQAFSWELFGLSRSIRTRLDLWGWVRLLQVAPQTENEFMQ